MPARRLSALVAAFLLTAISVTAADWPQWNGPNRDGASPEKGLLKEWPKGGPPLAWKTNIGGGGYSTPLIIGDKLYITGSDDPKEGLTEFALCLNVKDASQVWKMPRPVGKGDYANGYGNGPRGTPAIDGGLLYQLGPRGDLCCLKLGDGSQVWAVNLPKDFGTQMMSGWGMSESVLIDGDKLLCTPGGEKGTMLALDKKTGKEVWRSMELKDAAAYASIAVAEIGGMRQYITQTASAGVGVRASDGKLLWREGKIGRGTAVIPSPVVHDGYAFFTAGYGAGCEAVKLEPDGNGGTKATLVYTKNDVVQNHHGGVVRVGDHVYGYSDTGGKWVCFDYKVGSMQPESEFKKFGKGSLIYADGRFYLYGEGSGEVGLFEAGPEAWVEKGRFKIPERSKTAKGGQVWTHPVIANGKLYLRDHDLLFCYDIAAK